MISFIVFAATLVLASTEVVQYNKDIECSIRGPQYWCQNEVTAKRCLATSYCSEHVWSKNKVETGEYCTMCQQYLGTLHMLLANNETQAEVLSAMENMCKMLPTSIASTCTEYVTQYGEEAIELLVKYTADPKPLCTMIGLCTATNGEDTLTPLLENFLAKNVGTTDYCTTCEQYVGTVHLLISNNASKTELINGLKSACTLLPASIASECSALMTLYAPQIIEYLVSYTADPSKFCTMIGLCKGQIAPQLVHSRQMNGVLKMSMESVPRIMKNDGGCEFCQSSFSELQIILKSNATISAIQTGLIKVCNTLPSPKKEYCLRFDVFLPMYISWFEDMKTRDICINVFHLCPNTTVVESAPVAKVATPSSATTCEFCTVAMGYLEGILKENKTEVAVKTALDELCGYLPSSLGDECKLLVSEYSDQIIVLIVDELKDPATICKELGLCSSLKKAVTFKKMSLENPITCEVCQLAMGYLAKMVEGNKTEAAVIKALDELCADLPSSVAGECKSLVDTYADQIIKLIVSELADPTELCKEIGLCTSSVKVNSIKKTMPNNPVTCEICEVAMGCLENMLKGNTTEAAVKEALDKLCSYLPSTYESECTSLVDQYADEIIHLIVSELADPATLCKELSLCSSRKVTLPRTQVGCKICMFAMGKLDAILSDKSTEAEIKEAVESLCTHLPASMSGECKSLIEQYSDVIITMLVQEMDPSKVCQAIGLCEKEKTQLGSRKHVLAMRMSLKGVSCEVCEYAMGYLDNLLVSKAGEAKVTAAVEKVCSYLPKAFENECDALITEYGDDLIKLVVQQIQPAHVCKSLKLCD